MDFLQGQSHVYVKEHCSFVVLQVCEVHRLHRETFYLAQDFFDRFMSTQQNVVKTLLQLIGISSLFIAAKLEVKSRSAELEPSCRAQFLKLAKLKWVDFSGGKQRSNLCVCERGGGREGERESS